MRVLFISSPGAGHVFPLVPLAWAFRTAGHEVMMGTCGEGLRQATGAGLPVVDIAPGFCVQDFFRQLFADDPGMPVRDREAARKREVHFAVTLFAPVNQRLADGVMRLAQQWRPELVVYDELGAIGALVGAALDVPAVYHNYGFVRTRPLWQGLQEALADLYERYGLARPAAPAATLDPAPPSMVAEPDGWSVRYLPYSGGGVLPTWLSDPPTRPRIAASLGTVTPALEGPGLMRRIVDVAAGVDAEFVLALGGRPPASLGEVPSNVRAVEWVPMNALLPTCNAIIHHGTSDAALTAVAAGVPQLVLPFGKHHFIIGDAVGKRGNGLSAEPDDLDAALLARLLSDHDLRVAARQVQAELAALPAPAQIADRLASTW